jgi:plastocyanin
VSFRKIVGAALAAAGLLVVGPVSAAQALTKSVTMGEPVKYQKAVNSVGGDVDDFFPHGIKIHVGDSVKFLPVNFHTIDLEPKGGKAQGLVSISGLVSGVNDAAGNPFWFNGQAAPGFNPALLKFGFGKKFTYTGKNRILSGLPIQNKPKPMTVKFTKRGKFTFFCNVHPGMHGTVTVVSKSSKVPSAKTDAKVVKLQAQRDIAVAKTLNTPPTTPNQVQVGGSGKYGVEHFGFLPQTLTVPAGTTVLFHFQTTATPLEVHTATFGPGDPNTPSSYIGQVAQAFNMPVFDPRAVYPSDPPPNPAVLNPSSHGNGFWNSGILDNDPADPYPTGNAVTFDTAGTYNYYCMVHPFMHGIVVVQ